MKKLKAFRPELRVVLTVSPVRHLRDGFIENQRSKASLLLSCEALEQQFDWVQYFPSYELLLDDLRDYRFFTEDMTHPSPEAINYIWDAFQNSYFSASTKAKIVQIEKIKQAIDHRPFHPESEQHQKFIRDTLNKLQLLQAENPNIDFSSEIDGISSQ
ncbi:MAG: GSCFA domain-containing protein [Saprospiraceae bacterium]